MDAQLPVKLPTVEHARYHIVAIARGSLEPCAKHYPGSIGTLQINTDVEGGAHLQTPFTIGVLDRGKPFVHVFDEFSLKVVLGELDTATDFVTYLRAREVFLSDQTTAVWAAGEELLISAYLITMVGDEHSFIPRTEGGAPDTILFDESHYAGLTKRREHQDKKRADEPSYFWDELIERFIKLGDPKLLLANHQQEYNESEQALRLLAAEGRFGRRVLSDCFKGLLIAAQETPGRRRARLGPS